MSDEKRKYISVGHSVPVNTILPPKIVINLPLNQSAFVVGLPTNEEIQSSDGIVRVELPVPTVRWLIEALRNEVFTCETLNP